MGIHSLDKFFLCSALCAGLTAMSFAYPSNPVLRTIDNDGDSLSVRTLGDEHYRFTQTEDGFLVMRDSNGVFFFANENAERSRFKAKNPARRTAEEKAFLNGLDNQKVRDRHREKHPDRYKRPDSRQKSKRASWVPTAKSPDAAGGANASASAAEDVPPVLRLPAAYSHANGTNRFPVFLVEDNNTKNADSASTYAYMNQENYKAKNYVGSIRDYFIDQSGGLFVPSFDLYIVKVSDSFQNYIGVEYKLIQKTIEAVLSKYPSFDAGAYDSDNDGEVDAFAVLYAGNIVESGDSHLGGFQYELRWNACGRLSAGNGKRFNNYFILNQVGDIFERFIHEFSHTMGLRDHYCVWSDSCYISYSNSDTQAPGAHAWDVMATGMYNGQNNPPNYSAFERNCMGWLEYTTLEKDSEVKTLPPLGTSNFAYHAGASKNEWFVFENRQKVKWDAALPNHGLLVWHIDYDANSWTDDNLNDVPRHQRVDVVEAGNQRVTDYYDGFASSSYGGSHLKDDPFPGSQNVTKLSPVLSWKNVEVLPGLFNIKEQDDLVCFAVDESVAVGNCELPKSSSSSVVSSSSVASSSSVESSGSAVMSSSSSSSFRWPWRSSSSTDVASSSATERLAADAVPHVGFEVRYEGGMLNVLAPVAGAKTVRLFDMQGHLVFAESFDGMSHGVNLRKSRSLVSRSGFLIVRVDAAGKSLGYRMVGVR